MEYLKLIRVKHWLKNGLIFLPVFFSLNLLKTSYLGTCILGFLVFSLVSSIVYIINDINDLEKDKLHPIKKDRPLASGKVKVLTAEIIIGILGVLSIILMFLLYQKSENILVFVIPCIYLLINILYSFGFKNIPIIDVVIIVAGFVLRVMYGGVIINVEVSKYLYLMIIFGSFFLGFGKRRNEIIKNGEKSRKVLAKYNEQFLDKNMYISLALAVVSYTLWAVDPTTISRVGNDYMFWTIPLVMIILQLYSLNIEGNSHGDPIEVILSDKKIIIVSIIYMIVMGVILYIC